MTYRFLYLPGYEQRPDNLKPNNCLLTTIIWMIKDNSRGTVNIGNNNVHTVLIGGKRLLRIALKLNLKKE